MKNLVVVIVLNNLPSHKDGGRGGGRRQECEMKGKGGEQKREAVAAPFSLIPSSFFNFIGRTNTPRHIRRCRTAAKLLSQ